ncbi:MAG TPA: aminoglycoside phosphotransferase family protein [Herpetosiphonaceae bacterium]|nr:aminoglycoside phosphotransferase family protein [Herpetosiphonaceae bacterium]
MSHPPGLPDDRLLDEVETQYVIRLAGLNWLDGGADSHAWVAMGTAPLGGSYVVKVRSGPFDSASLRLAHHLRKQGLGQVVAPLTGWNNRQWATVDDYTFSVYPFIQGIPAAERGLAPDQWTAFGRLVRQLHDQTLPPDLASEIRAETWDTPWPAQVAALTAAVEAADQGDPVAASLAGVWRQHRAAVELLAGRAEALAARLAATPAPLVLCHADLHTWNVLVDHDRHIWLIDWDTAMVARKERDLMFAIEGISHDLVSPEASQWFLDGYGPARPDPQALAYYRCAWAIQDCVSFGEEILARPELGEAARLRALRLLSGVFKPGQIVRIALESSGGAP